MEEQLSSQSLTPAAHASPDREFRPMDAIRAIATTSIVALHAATPYVNQDLPHLLWPVHEPAASPWADWLFWTVRCFARATLFLIAGFASMAVMERFGPKVFLQRRAIRLAIPLLAGLATVLPLMYLVWAWGWVRSGLALPKHIVHVRFRSDIQQELYGFAHLWFLWYLLLTSIALACLRMLLPKARLPQQWCEWISWPPLRWIVVALPVSLVVYLRPEAIFDFRNGFIPRLDFLAYHLPFFAIGLILFRTRRELARSIRFWWLELLAAAALLPALHILISRRDSELANPALLAGVVGAFGALVSTALIGWSASSLAPRATCWQWLARRSFFIYFWHLPFVGLIHVALYRVELPTPLKILLAFATGIVGAALVFRMLHGTRVGRWLGDRETPAQTQG